MAVARRHGMRRFAAALTSLALAVPATAETSLCCPADITGNGIVNSADLGVLLSSWGSEGKAEAGADINGDGAVNSADLAALLSAWGACPSPCLRTRLTGSIRYADGTPAASALVSTNFGATATADSAGNFEILLEAPDATAQLEVTVATELGGTPHSASRSTAALAFEGVTDLGAMLLTPTSLCPTSDWLSMRAGDAASNGSIYALCSFDDGSGPKIYAGGSFTSINGVAATHVARWNGKSWEPLGSGLNWYVNALAVYDHGTGPALYAGGGFGGALARWNGSSWVVVGGIALEPGNWSSPSVEALAVFDDGSGPALYVGGAFNRAGGLSVQGIARWNGAEWSVLPSFPFTASIRSLAVLDAGLGKSLYASVDFQGGGAGTSFRVARLAGPAWDFSYGVMDGPVEAMTVFDCGGGPRLIAGGGFTTGGGPWNRGLVKWTGTSWEPLGGGLNQGGVSELVPFTDEGGTSLFVFGGFRLGNNPDYQIAARWDPRGWRDVGLGLNDTPRAAVVHDEGAGPSIVVGGWFTQAGGNPSAGVARWGCQP